MRPLFLLMVGLSMVFSIFAQKPQPCKAPPYLEGKLSVVYPEGKTVVFEQFFYDAVEQRIRVIASGKEGTHNVFVDSLLFFKERFYYEINYHNQTCAKIPLSAAFSPLEIPINAQHKAQFVIGSLSAPAQGLLVNDWVGSVPEQKGYIAVARTKGQNAIPQFLAATAFIGTPVVSPTWIPPNYSMSYTEFGCIPVTVLYNIEKTGHILSSFFDIVIGLENPEVLIPPPFCASAKLVEQENCEVANFFTALL